MRPLPVRLATLRAGPRSALVLASCASLRILAYRTAKCDGDDRVELAKWRAELKSQTAATAMARSTSSTVSASSLVTSLAVDASPLESSLPARVRARLAYFLTEMYHGLFHLVRFLQLAVIFSPPLLASPMLIFPGKMRHYWRLILIRSLHLGGPAFQKLGQWASTRPDLFGSETRRDLESFHSRIPEESWEKTRKTVEESIAPQTFDEMFSSFNTTPTGAGCIAQVHHAVLRADGTRVAVKVRRRDVARRITRDVDLIVAIARLGERLIPALNWFSVLENAENFASFMKSQLDLRVEAAHLKRFTEIFNNKQIQHGEKVVFPKPVAAYERLLIETFEDGVLLSNLLALDPKLLRDGFKAELAEVGVHSFLEMVIVQNYTHSDLHPGNILVRTIPPFDLTHPERPVKLDALVYLDAGLVTVLNPKDQRNFIDLFMAVAHGDGELAANLMIDRSRYPDSVVDRPGFIRGMSDIVNSVSFSSFRLDRVRIGDVLEKILALVHNHRVKLDPAFTSLVISIIVLEGVGRQLFPSLDIFAASAPMLLRAHRVYKKAAVEAVLDLVRRNSTADVSWGGGRAGSREILSPRMEENLDEFR